MIEALQLLIVGLGTARLTGLVTRDSITHPIRDIIFTFWPPENNARLGHEYQNFFRATEEERAGRANVLGLAGSHWPRNRYIHGDYEERPPTFIGELISCPYCISVWIAALNYGLYSVEAIQHQVLIANTFLTIAWIGAVAAVKGGWK